MNGREYTDYYIDRKIELLEEFDDEAREWEPVLSRNYGDYCAAGFLQVAREEFEALIQEIPYIGGEANHLTSSLVGSVRCLALYLAMKVQGRLPLETGKMLYDSIVSRSTQSLPQVPSPYNLSSQALMDRRRKRALHSQNREYNWDYVYEFVEGDGETFDYGYNFIECATHKFYFAKGVAEFLPYYCFLDFPKCEQAGLGLTRLKTLAEGDDCCEFRFVEGGKAALEWPPPFS